MADGDLPLRMSVRRSGGRAFLRLVGEADLSVRPRLEMRLRDLVAGDDDVVVVEAAALTFLDLACLTSLMEAADGVRARGGELVLRAPTRRVRRLLGLVGAHERLTVDP